VHTLRAVRLDADGTLTDLAVPTGEMQLDVLREAVGGLSEIRHYARQDGSKRLVVVVNAEDQDAPLSANLYATSLVSAVRAARLPYTLNGPTVLLGALGPAEGFTDLPAYLSATLPSAVAALKTRYGHAC
jgi:hypothetical protein